MPVVAVVKMPGFDTATGSVTTCEGTPELTTRTIVLVCPAISYGTITFSNPCCSSNIGAGVLSKNICVLPSSTGIGPVGGVRLVPPAANPVPPTKIISPGATGPLRLLAAFTTPAALKVGGAAVTISVTVIDCDGAVGEENVTVAV